METKKDIYLPELATIAAIRPLTDTETFFHIKLDSGQALGHMPGQFAEISLAGIGEAPISISSSPTMLDGFEMVVRKIGNVTGALHAARSGTKIGIRGPFGTAFPVTTAMQGKDLLFICAGLGLVPLRSAINYVLAHRQQYGNITIITGTKTPQLRLFTNELELWAHRKDIDFLETVDKADETWHGKKGLITTLIPGLKLNAPNTIALLCGPPIVYKFVLLELKKFNISSDNIYMSLERRMKCGVGKCGHCQINGLYACQDGPVFQYTVIEDVKEAI